MLQVIRPEEAGVLYSLVFGEGVMNDATSVAILRAVQVNARVDPGPWTLDPRLQAPINYQPYLNPSFVECGPSAGGAISNTFALPHRSLLGRPQLPASDVKDLGSRSLSSKT